MQVAMKFSTPGYQDIGQVLRGSMSSRIFSSNESHFKHHNLKMRGHLSMLGSKSLGSMSSRIFSCNESHFKHHNLKMRGHLSMLGSKSLNLKIRGQPSLLGSKLSAVSLVRKTKLVCKSFGSQDQPPTSLFSTLTPKYELFFTLISYATRWKFLSFSAFIAFIFAMFLTRPYQIGILVRAFDMNIAMASDVTLVIPTFLSCVIFCVVMDLKNLKSKNLVFTVGLASYLFSLVGKKIFGSISSGMMFYKQVAIGDFIYFKTKDVEVAGKVESMGLMSPLVIRSLSGEVHSIPINTFADAAHVRMTVGPYKIISFKVAVSQNMAHKIDDIITNIDEIVSKFSSHKNELQNFACVEGMDHNFKDVMILVSCLVEVVDVKEYIRIKGAIILEVFKLLAEVNNATSR